MKPPIVWRDGLRLLNVSYKLPTRFFNAGVEIVIVDNDKKAHDTTVTDAWAKFGIKVWPGTGKSKIGLSLLNSPARMQRTFEVSQ